MPALDHAAVTLHEALTLPPMAAGRPQLLSPGVSLEHPVRWAHVIGEPRPGPLLQGGELILSTLPLLHEGRQDLEELLRGYLEDLDDVDAAGLAVEVLPERPRLAAALERVCAERAERPDAHTLTPVLRFSQVVRFVEITEHLHRELVARQLRTGGHIRDQDPLLEATSALLEDLAAVPPLAEAVAVERARSLGLPSSARLIPLVFAVDASAGALPQRGWSLEALAGVVRQAGAQLHMPLLVGSCHHRSLAVLAAAPAGMDVQRPTARLCRAVERSLRRRLPEAALRCTAALGEPAQSLHGARRELDAAWEVAALAASLRGRGRHLRPAVPEFWTAGDIRLWGVLAELERRDVVERLLAHELRLLRGTDAETRDLRALIEALVRTRGSKTQLAARLGVSRPTLYARLESLERRLGRPLDDGETLTTLHVALMLEELSGSDLPD